MRSPARCTVLAILTLALAGCAGTPSTDGTLPVMKAPPSASTYASVLTSPERLQPIGGTGAQRWIDPNADFRIYDSVLIEPIRVKLSAESAPVDPAAIKAMTDYFRDALIKAAQPGYRVVDTPGPGVLRMRITLVDLVATRPEVSVAVLVTPYATIPDFIVSEASGVPRGSAPYLGRTGIAAEFVDGGSGSIVAEFVDVQFGRRYVLDTSKGATEAVNTATKSYLNQYSTWAYAKQAFDLWASEFRSMLEDLRAKR